MAELRYRFAVETNVAKLESY